MPLEPCAAPTGESLRADGEPINALRGDRRELDDVSREWLASLGDTGPARERAFARLHELLLRFPALRGGPEILDAAAATVKGRRAAGALDELRRLTEVLRHHGVEKAVRIDLGAIRDLDYYSGVVFEIHGEDAARAVDLEDDA